MLPVEIDITQEQIDNAKRQRDLMPQELNNSIRHGEGTFIGKLGEQIVAKILGIKLPVDTYNYDMEFMDKKIEVKTKELKVPKVESYYECSISNANPNQRCDYYAFVRIMGDLSKAWWCGLISKKEYFENCKFHKKGELDSSNNFTFKWDCYNLPISELHGIVELVKAI